MRNRTWIALSALLVFGAMAAPRAEPPVLTQIREFVIPEANQGVGVDAHHFYAVETSDRQVDKKTGKFGRKWQGAKAAQSSTSTARCSWTARSTPRTPTIPTGR